MSWFVAGLASPAPPANGQQSATSTWRSAGEIRATMARSLPFDVGPFPWSSGSRNVTTVRPNRSASPSASRRRPLIGRHPRTCRSPRGRRRRRSIPRRRARGRRGGADLGVPREREVGLGTAADADARDAGIQRQQALDAVAVPVDQEQLARALRLEARLELLGRGAVGRVRAVGHVASLAVSGAGPPPPRAAGRAPGLLLELLREQVELEPQVAQPLVEVRPERERREPCRDLLVAHAGDAHQVGAERELHRVEPDPTSGPRSSRPVRTRPGRGRRRARDLGVPGGGAEAGPAGRRPARGRGRRFRSARAGCPTPPRSSDRRAGLAEVLGRGCDRQASDDGGARCRSAPR